MPPLTLPCVCDLVAVRWGITESQPLGGVGECNSPKKCCAEALTEFSLGGYMTEDSSSNLMDFMVRESITACQLADVMVSSCEVRPQRLHEDVGRLFHDCYGDDKSMSKAAYDYLLYLVRRMVDLEIKDCARHKPAVWRAHRHTNRGCIDGCTFLSAHRAYIPHEDLPLAECKSRTRMHMELMGLSEEEISDSLSLFGVREYRGFGSHLVQFGGEITSGLVRNTLKLLKSAPLSP